MAVFGSPAALTLAVAGTCGINKHLEGNVAFVKLTVLSYGLCTFDTCTESHCKKHLFKNTSVKVAENVKTELIIYVVTFDDSFTHSINIVLGEGAAEKLF